MRDRLARAGVAWFTTTRRPWTHGHGTRSTEKDGLDLGAETRLTWGDEHPKGFEPRRCRVTGSADTPRPADYLSDRFGKLGERRGDAQCGTGVDAEVVVDVTVACGPVRAGLGDSVRGAAGGIDAGCGVGGSGRRGGSGFDWTAGSWPGKAAQRGTRWGIGSWPTAALPGASPSSMSGTATPALTCKIRLEKAH